MTELEPIERLSKKDLGIPSLEEARFLVDYYYQLQDVRIRADHQRRKSGEIGEPTALVQWLTNASHTAERTIVRALDVMSDQSEVGRWSKSVKGVGPVIAAGLLAHIDIDEAPTVGHIWRFAGLDPTVKWKPNTKRPWNGDLKTLCWKIGESFVKVSGSKDAFYGKIYIQRKALEVARNDEGLFADQAALSLKEKHYRDDTIAKKFYEAGKLPPARIHMRAKRYAVKLFLSHWHDVAYREKFGKAPPLPYPIAHLGHADLIEVPA